MAKATKKSTKNVEVKIEAVVINKDLYEVSKIMVAVENLVDAKNGIPFVTASSFSVLIHKQLASQITKLRESAKRITKNYDTNVAKIKRADEKAAKAKSRDEKKANRKIEQKKTLEEKIAKLQAKYDALKKS